MGGEKRLKSDKVMVIGDALIDHRYWVERMPRTGEDVKAEKLAHSFGGGAANTAFALADGGTPCFFCGSVGEDEDGAAILSRMNKAGIDTGCAQTGGQTGHTITVIDHTGERTMMSFRGAAGRAIAMREEIIRALRSAGAVLLSGYLLSEPAQAAFLLEAAETAHAAGALTALDPTPVIGKAQPDLLARLLRVTDVVLPNRSELIQMAGTDDPQQALIMLDAACVVMTDGEVGARMALSEGFRFGRAGEAGAYHAAAKKTNTTDTTGAGDAFNAGFLAAICRGNDPQQWLEAGNAAAAAVIGKQSAKTAED